MLELKDVFYVNDEFVAVEEFDGYGSITESSNPKVYILIGLPWNFVE
jgi:hypothetical protein